MKFPVPEGLILAVRSTTPYTNRPEVSTANSSRLLYFVRTVKQLLWYSCCSAGLLQ